jgi:molybdopterin-guanine dinucleotide biosynthesis protein A
MNINTDEHGIITTNENDTIGLAVLAGGKSSRMNYQPKADLKINEKTLLEHIFLQFSMFSEKLLSVSEVTADLKSKDFLTAFTLIPDQYESIGPIGGIYSSLSVCKSDALFIVACDMPFLTLYSFELLKSNLKRHDICILKTTDGLQPLCGIYRKSCIPLLKQLIEEKDYRLNSIVSRADCFIVNSDYAKEVFNINTPKDYQTALNLNP